MVVRGSHCMYEENQPSISFHSVKGCCCILVVNSGDDRNFALESYGVGSKCFDHTEQMWEERSCSQVN